jgi:hypothetical protein
MVARFLITLLIFKRLETCSGVCPTTIYSDGSTGPESLYQTFLLAAVTTVSRAEHSPYPVTDLLSWTPGESPGSPVLYDGVGGIGYTWDFYNGFAYNINPDSMDPCAE